GFGGGLGGQASRQIEVGDVIDGDVHLVPGAPVRGPLVEPDVVRGNEVAPLEDVQVAAEVLGGRGRGGWRTRRGGGLGGATGGGWGGARRRSRGRRRGRRGARRQDAGGGRSESTHPQQLPARERGAARRRYLISVRASFEHSHLSAPPVMPSTK